MTLRNDYGVTGTNNAAKQVSVTRWNGLLDDIDTKFGPVPVNPCEYGVVEGSASGANGAANSTALEALFTALKAEAVNPATFYQGLRSVRFPPGYYEFASTIDITDGTLIIEGADTGGPFGRGTILKFPSGVTGIRVQAHDTSGATDTDDPTHRGGNGTVIRNLALYGGFGTAGTEGEYHGIHLRAKATILDCYIYQFEGDGIHGDTTSSTSNINLTVIKGGRIRECRNGVFLDGADANVCVLENVDATLVRRWGFYDSSFLGNTYIACHAASNGRPTTNTPSSRVHYGGQRYFVIAGQEAGASTNAPSGTTADNTWWAWLNTGGVSSTQYPDWVSGTTYRTGGSFYADSTSSVGYYGGCYHEAGQGEAQIVAPNIVIGGKLSENLHLATPLLKGASSGYVNTTNFRITGTFRPEGQTVGMDLTSGSVYKVNGTQVVGAQGAAVADATDAASAITQLNALLSRLRAHGLIAT